MVDFKSSFIPRKPIVEGTKRLDRHSSISPLTIFGIVALLLALGGFGGLYAYKFILNKQIKDKAEAIERTKQQIDPKAIDELKKFDARLETAKTLLRQHVALEGLFMFLEKRTLKTVRFDQLSYIAGSAGGVLTMRGEAKGYNSLALQSDAFSEDGLLQLPIFSQLRLSEKGSVNFNFTAQVDPHMISYSDLVNPLPTGSPTNLEMKIDDGSVSATGTP